MRSRSNSLVWLVVISTAFGSSEAHAQMPGTPVLQNAFANPGITAALNVASLGGASSYAAAAAWAPGSARFQLSAGVGLQTRTDFPRRTIYGARLNVPILGATSSFGVSAFAGYGAISGAAIDSSEMKSLVPIGATLSYRLSVGSGHGLSLYGSPIYELVGRGGGASNVSVFRGALGLDVGITQSIGVTIGVELGKKEAEGADSGRPSGTSFGAAVSYAMGAR